jgi:Rrf2 family protein
MFLSNTAQYAVRILLYMANDPEKKYSAAELIQKLKISDKYLRRIMTDMAKAGFIESISGRKGGYIFKKNVEEIKLSEIIFSFEDQLKFDQCLLGLENCGDDHPCKLHSSWKCIKEDLVNLLNSTTLNSLDAIPSTKY